MSKPPATAEQRRDIWQRYKKQHADWESQGADPAVLAYIISAMIAMFGPPPADADMYDMPDRTVPNGDGRTM